MPQFENIETYLRTYRDQAAAFVEGVRANPGVPEKHTVTYTQIVNKDRVNGQVYYRGETARLLDTVNGLLTFDMIPKVSDATFAAVERVQDFATTAQAYNAQTPATAPVVMALITTYTAKNISELVWSLSYKAKLVAYSENVPPAAAVHTVLESYSCEITPIADLTKIVSLVPYEVSPQ